VIVTRRGRIALPLELHWREADSPLPRRSIRPPRRAKPKNLGLEAAPWLATGPTDRPFDFCAHVRRLCADIVRHCGDLRHVDVSRLLFAVTQARSDRRYGLQARVTPMRFEGGELTRRFRGVNYQVQRYFVDGAEVLYLVVFCLPRFLDQSFEEKFVTLFHELFHISPAFEGDLRRHGGRYDLHSRSKSAYDRQMAEMAREYLGNGADRNLHGFLRLNFAQLAHRHGGVVGAIVPRPRLIPVSRAEEVRIHADVADGRE
jgi:hypothetical protein